MKRKSYIKQLFSLIATLLLINIWIPANAQHTIAQQWHFSADNNGSQDWILGMLATDKKEYICVGYSGSAAYGTNLPVIFKLDHTGKLVWAQLVTSFTSGGTVYTSTTSAPHYGFFRQVVKTSNGYAATGTIEPSSNYQTLLAEFDENGNFINGTPFAFLTSSLANSIGQTIAMDPSGNGAYIIGGDGDSKAYISIIDYTTHSISSQIFGPSTGGSSIKKVLTETKSGGYNIYACGFKSMSSDNVSHISTNTNSAAVTVVTLNKDIWVLKTDNNLSSTPIFDVTYNKGNLGSILYNDYGPLSAGNITTANSAGYNCPAAAFLQSSSNDDERAYDMIFTQDGNLAITGMIHIIETGDNGDPGNGLPTASHFDVIQSAFTSYEFADPIRTGVTYKEYFDGDLYILKADKSAGSITATGCWNKMLDISVGAIGILISYNWIKASVRTMAIL